MNFLAEKDFLNQFTPEERERSLCAHLFDIRTSETDRHHEIHTDVVFSLLQEIANFQVIEFGIDGHLERPPVFSWIVNRVSLRLEKSPTHYAPVKMYTWQSGMDRLGFTRDYYLFDEDGTAYGAATSYWTVVTPGEHRLIRPASLFDGGENPFIVDFSALDHPPVRIRPHFADFTDAVDTSRKVGESDIDSNGHLNNTRYVALCRDAADLLEPRGKFKRIDINYVAEMFKGETAEVLAAPYPNPKGDPEAIKKIPAIKDLNPREGEELIAIRCPAAKGQDRFRAILGFGG